MIITTTADLAKHCMDWAKQPFITVDTEFMRDKTYWPKLCLIQVGWDGGAAAIDPLAAAIDLTPFFEVLADTSVAKVFHAARQDLEIFYYLMGKLPSPLIDTQVAAMVCGFGEQVSYENLVSSLAGKQIDKSMRFTDWSIRPLSEGHIQYALGDVIHLRPVYLELERRAKQSGRWDWIREEMQKLETPDSYAIDPDQVWRRLRARSNKPKFLAYLRSLCAWRERKAQSRDVPRGRVVKDEGILEIASYPPKAPEDFKRFRNVYGIGDQDRKDIIQAIESVNNSDPKTWPAVDIEKPLSQSQSAQLELLKVLLRVKADQEKVAAKLIATSDDLDEFVRGDENSPLLQGWRHDIFGKDAVALSEGKLSLGFDKRGLKLVTSTST